MFEYTKALLREKRPNPFYRNISKLSLIQSRNYAETDHLLPEEQWAQLTFKFEVKASEDDAQDSNKIIQYNVFERRLADKLSYMDWKLSYIIDTEDF